MILLFLLGQFVAFTSQLENNSPSEVSAVSGLAFSLSFLVLLIVCLGRWSQERRVLRAQDLCSASDGCDDDRHYASWIWKVTLKEGGGRKPLE